MSYNNIISNNLVVVQYNFFLKKKLLLFRLYGKLDTILYYLSLNNKKQFIFNFNIKKLNNMFIAYQNYFYIYLLNNG